MMKSIELRFWTVLTNAVGQMLDFQFSGVVSDKYCAAHPASKDTDVSLDGYKGQFAVVKVDLDVDANYDGKIDDADEPLEENPGGLVCVSTNQLTKIKLKLLPAGLPGKVTFEAPEGGGLIRVWTNANRTGQITLPKTWNAGAQPGALYVEGVTNSVTARDVELKLEYAVAQPGASGEGERCKDTVRLTVVKVDLKEISFSGTKCYAVKKDDGSQDYTAPHWQDNSSPLDGDADDAGDKKYPVCFTRNTKMIELSG